MDRNMLARATSSDDSPTPGYMYGEIAKMTLASFEACKWIEEYLLKRLEKKNANVKRKTLLLIKHVARSGRPEFRRDLCRHLGPIKECLSFTGPPDPLRGDEMYSRVREAAKEAMESVTSDPVQQPAQQQQSSYASQSYESSSRYEGYGNSPMPKQPETYMEKAAALATGWKDKALDAAASFASGAGSAGYVGGSDRSGELPSTSRMTGFGNPHVPVERTQTWSEKAQSLGRRAGLAVRNVGFKNDIKEDLSSVYATNRGANSWGGAGSAEGSYDVPRELSRYAETQQNHQSWAAARPEETSAARSSSPRARGAVGGVWGNMGGGGGGPSQQQQQQQQQYQPEQEVRRNGGAGGADRDGEYERTLVTELCSAGGTRAAPPQEKLESFVRAAATLESDVVGPNLLDLLDDERPWQVKCKALAVVEALATADGCEHHKAYFAEVAEDLAYLANNPPVAVQKNARKMLAALGVETSASCVDSRRAARRAPRQQDALFASEESVAEITEPTDQPSEEPPPPQETPDLLGGYDEPTSPPTSTTSPPGSTTASPQTSGLFDDLSLKTPDDQPKKAPEIEPSNGDVSLLYKKTPEINEPSNGDVSLLYPTPARPSESRLDPFATADAVPPNNTSVPLTTNGAPPVNGGDPFSKTTTTTPKNDPFASLGELGDVSSRAPAPATGPAFVATTLSPAYQQHQILQQQQMQMNAQMYALMQQQQRLAQQQRQLAATKTFPQQGPYAMQSYATPVPDVSGSSFSFMAQDSKAKQADSFSFVNDMMK
ncbi:hypothetical protein CTAYLR_008626 [Chrysophaeum taylorii]|uniref:ENTH domain-containing protein n=1 Tax=Chrysophaeum taylorii TaxID=2483200 RepID=A0AAD7XKM4_9STRA|nr:hypothetical protein CTAYLR_008626 [Chrysophaeum taylorii]